MTSTPRLSGAAGGLLAALTLAGCAQQPELPPTTTVNATRSDFTGSWEINYGRSDDVNQELRQLFRRLNSSTQRQARGGARSGNSGFSASGASAQSVIDLARLAESITRTQVLEIEHNEDTIEVKREDDFSLTCGFFDTMPELSENLYGNEICGWDGHQLVFHIGLPDGLTVSHRMTVAPSKQQLHLATTVKSITAPVPFTLNQFFDRFEEIESEFDCEYTLTREKVCSPKRSSP
ncbi:MAG: hypothetical protein AAGD86_08855 [Pseudomonadota bacterium]